MRNPYSVFSHFKIEARKTNYDNLNSENYISWSFIVWSLLIFLE